MSWEAYRLTYRAVSPLALGAYRFGFIQRTRYFCPGWTLWGALTAQLTRAAFTRAAGAEYEAVGRFVADNLPTSYAYVLVGGEPAWPHYVDGRLHYGSLSAAEFESRFVTSYGQTAVAPATLAAQTDTLHETELLSPYDLDGGEPVAWQFTLYARVPWQEPPPALAGWAAQDAIGALEPLILGGDRGYGFGRLARTDCRALGAQGEGEWPAPVEWPAAENTLRAHVETGELDGKKITVRGQVEPVARRLWQNEAGEGRGWGPGQRRKTHVLYAPGSCVEGEWAPVVGPLGLWRTAP